MRPAPLLAAALAVVALAACTSPDPTVEVQGTSPATSAAQAPPTTAGPGTTTPGTAAPTTTPQPPSTIPAGRLDWQDCDDELQCATLEVPLDYTDPTGDTIDLALVRRPATDESQRIGSLLVNPGGPGIPGTLLAQAADGVFSQALLRRFDIVGWDPRGTGQSSPVDCVDDLDPYLALDPTPDTASEKQQLIDSAQEFGALCEESNGRILPFISTQDSARDMDEIRRALGEDKISYYGFSYGSELGANYATLFPRSVRAMIVDGAVDPNSDVVDEAKRQVVGLEKALNDFLADCAGRDRCAFHNGGDPGAALDGLLARLDTDPLRADGREVGQGKAYTAIVSALYDSDDWPNLAVALDDAANGDGQALLDLYDSYVQRFPDGTFTNAFEGLIAINCLDDPGPTDLAFPDRFAPELEQLAPRLGRASAFGYFCAFWPAKGKGPLAITGAGAGPILVIGTTGDPITPLESTRRLADELEQGVLVTVDAAGHTGYGKNGCIVRTVDRYLIDLRLPETGLVCG